MGFKLSPQPLDEDLVLQFFWRFSVFECALKREGFLKQGRDNAAEADWNRFGQEIEGKFKEISLPGFMQAVEKIWQLSPRRQIVRNGRLAWESVARRINESDEAYTLRILKIARNNLFHGGKYPDGPIQEVARNRDILRAALSILNGCYEIHAGVKKWISNAA